MVFLLVHTGKHSIHNQTPPTFTVSHYQRRLLSMHLLCRVWRQFGSVPLWKGGVPPPPPGMGHVFNCRSLFGVFWLLGAAKGEGRGKEREGERPFSFPSLSLFLLPPPPNTVIPLNFLPPPPPLEGPNPNRDADLDRERVNVPETHLTTLRFDVAHTPRRPPPQPLLSTLPPRLR